MERVVCVCSCALVCVRAGGRVRVHIVRRTLDLYQLHKDRHICLRVGIKQENSNKRLACLERERVRLKFGRTEEVSNQILKSSY